MGLCRSGVKREGEWKQENHSEYFTSQVRDDGVELVDSRVDEKGTY